MELCLGVGFIYNFRWIKNLFKQELNVLFLSKVDPAPACWARAPLFDIFENFDWIICINFFVINMHCLQYTCIFYSLLSGQKHRVMCQGASKQFPDLKNYTAQGAVLIFLNLPLPWDSTSSVIDWLIKVCELYLLKSRSRIFTHIGISLWSLKRCNI